MEHTHTHTYIQGTDLFTVVEQDKLVLQVCDYCGEYIMC